MARYVAADCKRCRREKMKLFLKGAKCESPKCPFETRPYPPGQHGRGRPATWHASWSRTVTSWSMARR